MSKLKRKDDDLLSEISTIFLAEWDQWSPIFTEIQEGWDYLGGKQYTDEQIKYYTKKRRPTNVFNNYLPIFTMFLGNYLQSQNRTRVHPRCNIHPFVAEQAEKILNHYEYESDAMDEFAGSILSGLILMGWMQVDWNNDREIDGSLVFKNVDEFDIMFDSRSRDAMLNDAAYMFRSKWLDPRDIKWIWPDKRKELEKSIADCSDTGYFDVITDSERDMITSPVYQDRGQYRILEYHSRKWEAVDVAMDLASGESEILTLEGKKRDLWLRMHPQTEIISSHRPVKYITECIPGLNIILSHRKAPLQDGTFDYVNYSAFNLGKQTYKNFGYHRIMKGPQKAYNDMENTLADIWNKQALGLEKVKPDEIRNYQQFKTYGHEPGFILEFEKNAQIDQAHKREKPPTLPQSGVAMADRYREFLHITTNARENFMGGAETGNENASLFAQRVQEAEKGSIFSLRAYRRMHRRIAQKALKLLQQNMSLEKFYLITTDINAGQQEQMKNQMAAQQILHDFKTAEFKIVMDDLAQSQTVRYARFNQKSQLAQMIMQALGPMAIDWRDWLEDADGDLDKWIERIEQVMQMNQDNAEQQEAMANARQLMQAAKEKQTLTEDSGLPQERPTDKMPMSAPNI